MRLVFTSDNHKWTDTMTDIQWDAPAHLMRVTRFTTAEPAEEVVGQGTLMELVGTVLEMAPDAQGDLLLRAAGRDWTQEFDTDAIRELAARPEFTGAMPRYDTAQLRDDPDRAEQRDVLLPENDFSEAVRQPGEPATGGAL